MTGAAKSKGDKGEREAAALLADLTGFPVRRKLGAGRKDDEGDLEGVPHTVVQVCSRTTDVVAVGVVAKPLQADRQARNAGVPFAVTMLRIRGGKWRMVMTPESYVALLREALADQPQETTWPRHWTDGDGNPRVEHTPECNDRVYRGLTVDCTCNGLAPNTGRK